MANTYQIICVVNLDYKEVIFMDVGREKSLTRALES